MTDRSASRNRSAGGRPPQDWCGRVALYSATHPSSAACSSASIASWPSAARKNSARIAWWPRCLPRRSRRVRLGRQVPDPMGAENPRHLGRYSADRGRPNPAFRRRSGSSWSFRRWDDLRLVGLKLIFLVVTRAVSVLGLSRREAWWKDAEILMLRHQLAVACASGLAFSRG